MKHLKSLYLYDRIYDLYIDYRDYMQDNWARMIKYISVISGMIVYAYIIYWIDSVESIKLVVTWFPNV